MPSRRLCLSLLLIVLSASLLWAQSPMAKLAHFSDSLADWQARAQSVRTAILTGAELNPLPERTPLNPILTNRRLRDSYSVEDVAFEATPGFYVFGNLYRPLRASKTNRVPAILITHGHFKEDGWFARTRPENQILCATLAQMGAVVFTFDMVGWGDSTQVSHSVRNVLQLQLWDSIRAVDFVESLPEVDPKRIGVTGASGGATQIVYLAAVDPRIAASMPVVQVSSRYSGSERCEDGMKVHSVPGPYDTNNAEIAALVAPHPLMLVSDGDDWTRHFPEEDFPYIQRIYELYGAADSVQNRHFPNEGHDYGPSKRRVAYRFFSRSFGLAAPPAHETAKIESQADQTVRLWVDLPGTFHDDAEGISAGKILGQPVRATRSLFTKNP